MQVFLKIINLPPDSAISLLLDVIPNVGVSIPSQVSLEDILEGVIVTVDDAVTSIDVLSSGLCDNLLSVVIEREPEPSTTTSTTSTSTSTTSTTTFPGPFPDIQTICVLYSSQNTNGIVYKTLAPQSGLVNGKVWYKHNVVNTSNVSLGYTIYIYWDSSTLYSPTGAWIIGGSTNSALVPPLAVSNIWNYSATTGAYPTNCFSSCVPEIWTTTGNEIDEWYLATLNRGVCPTTTTSTTTIAPTTTTSTTAAPTTTTTSTTTIPTNCEFGEIEFEVFCITTTTTTTQPTQQCDCTFVSLPAPGSSVTYNGLTITGSNSSINVELGIGNAPIGCSSCNNIITPPNSSTPDIRIGVTPVGGNYTGLYTLDFNQPINRIVIRFINLNSVPPPVETYTITTNSGVPTLSACASCNVSIIGNRIECNQDLPCEGGGTEPGGGIILAIENSTPFTSLTIDGMSNIATAGVIVDLCLEETLPCQVLLFGNEDSVHSYDVSTDTSTFLVSGLLGANAGLAHTDTKLWTYDNDNIYEYNITLNPWSISALNRTIALPAGVDLGSGLAAVNNTLLISTNKSVFPQQIINIDITNTNALVFDVCELQPNYQIHGDLLVTTTNKIITTEASLPPLNRAYIIQYDYLTGNLEFQLDITNTIPSPWGIFIQNGEIYIGAGNGDIYNIQKTFPYTLTLVGSLPGNNIFDASQVPNCSNVNMIPGDTPTTTTTSTTTLPPVPGVYTIFTYFDTF